MSFCSHFRNFSQIHYSKPVCHMTHYGQIMRDKKHCLIESFLKVLKKIYNLSLDRYIQSTYRLIGNNKLRSCSKSPGNTDSLALSSGKLMRITIKILIRQTYLLRSSFTRAVL